MDRDLPCGQRQTIDPCFAKYVKAPLKTGWGEDCCIRRFASDWVIVVVVLAIAAVFALVREQLIPFTADANRRSYLLTGDEPEYLLAAWSLAHDGDLNLYNDVREKVWEVFQKRPVCGPGHAELAHFQKISPAMANVSPEAWQGQQLLIHRPGVSVLVFPAAYAGQNFRWWAYFIVATFASVGIGAILFAARRAGASLFPAAVIASLLVLSPPGLFYANQAFPEVPAAVLLAVSASLLLSPGLPAATASGVCVAMAPWFSDRALLPAVVLGLAGLWLARKAKTRWVLLAVFGAGAGLLILYYWHRFHVPWPVHHNWRYSASVGNIPSLLPRILLDRDRGILWLCPALLLLPAAFYSWYRSGHHRILCVSIALALTAGLLGVASFPDWRGGVCPAGRYGVLIQWLALPVFLAWHRTGMSKTQQVLLLLLLLAGAMEILFVWNHPNWWYRSYHPVFGCPSLQRFYDILPNLNSLEFSSLARAGQWLAVFILYNLLALISAPVSRSK